MDGCELTLSSAPMAAWATPSDCGRAPQTPAEVIIESVSSSSSSSTPLHRQFLCMYQGKRERDKRIRKAVEGGLSRLGSKEYRAGPDQAARRGPMTASAVGLSVSQPGRGRCLKMVVDQGRMHCTGCMYCTALALCRCKCHQLQRIGQ